MPECKIKGLIDPVLKARIDRIQWYYDMMDRLYGDNFTVELRQALMERKQELIEQG